MLKSDSENLSQMVRNLTSVLSLSENRREGAPNPGPVISAIIPCYKVADYLPTLLSSLDNQDCNRSDVELIFVIDGSPDESEEIVSMWMKDASFSVRLVSQENQGTSGAKNTGIALARGEWLTCPDPDDGLTPNYFSEIIDGINGFKTADMFITRLVRVNERGNVIAHPLDFKFNGVNENALVDLELNPEKIHLAGATFVVRKKVLEQESLEYDLRLRNGFEDALLISEYLMRLDRPQYVILPNAHYYYYARSGSIVAESGRDFSTKLGVVEIGYSRLLAASETGCPAWLANVLLYDLYWIFKQYTRMHSPVFALEKDTQSRFSDLVRNSLVRIGLDNIRAFRVVNVPLDIRASWENAASPGDVSQVAVLRTLDRHRGLQKIILHSANPTLAVDIESSGRPLVIEYAKARELLFFNEVWAYEHIFWVPIEPSAGEISLRCKDEGTPLMFSGIALTPKDAGRRLGKVEPKRGPAPLGPNPIGEAARDAWKRRSRRKSRLSRLQYSFAYRAGGILGWRKAFKNAWVMIDRNTQANDNAEALYRFVKRNRPDINSWFVLDKSSPDWKRLKREGFRLVHHGSKKHFCLMKEAQVLASSMVDQYIVQPFAPRYLKKEWLYSFLQHGVTKEDLHRWWNFKNIDHFVTSTTDEHAAITRNPGPYKMSQREVTLTGMPRHDRLHELRVKAVSAGITRQRIVIMPTWRNYLMGTSKGAERTQLEGFKESEFVKEWSGFLNGEYLSRLASDPHFEVVLLPHPGIDMHWKDLVLPSGVIRASYATDDVQEILAGASVAVSDYSSQAFEAAFCNVPTAYFQFDRDEFFSGGHGGAPGYFDYFRDAFGPICETRVSLETNLRQLLDGSHPALPDYSDRMERLYPLRGESACENVVAAIEERTGLIK